MTTKENKYKAMYRCPRYNFCNAPICPLDPDYKLRVKLKGEDTCKMEKSVRVRLGEALPNKGKKPEELRAEKAWKNKTTEFKESFVRNGAKRLAKS